MSADVEGTHLMLGWVWELARRRGLKPGCHNLRVLFKRTEAPCVNEASYLQPLIITKVMTDRWSEQHQSLLGAESYVAKRVRTAWEGFQGMKASVRPTSSI